MLRQTISINYTDLVRGDWWIATHLLSTTVYKNVQITKCPTIPYSNQPWTHRKSSVEMGAQLFPRPTFFPSPEPKPTTRCLPTPSLLKSSGVVQSAPNRMESTMMNGAWKKKALKEQEVLERIGMLRLLGGITRNLVFMEGIPSRNTTGFGDLFTCSQSGRVGFKRIDLAQASCEWRYVVMIE